MEIVVIHEDITALEVDAIVNPALLNSDAAGALSARILEKGGQPLSQAFGASHPRRFGEAVLTSAGELRCRYVIHTAVAPRDANPPSLDALKQATLAAVRCAEDNHLRSLAIPDMGLGLELARQRGARAMVSVLREFDSTILNRVLLVDTDVEVIKAFEAALESLRD